MTAPPHGAERHTLRADDAAAATAHGAPLRIEARHLDRYALRETRRPAACGSLGEAKDGDETGAVAGFAAASASASCLMFGFSSL